MAPYQNHAAIQSPIAWWQASSLSQAQYCKEHGIKPHIFSYYKKKFSSDSALAKHSSQLVPVELVANDASHGSNLSSSSGSEVLRLTHANGFSLEITPPTDLASLKPLLELLRSVSWSADLLSIKCILRPGLRICVNPLKGCRWWSRNN